MEAVAWFMADDLRCDLSWKISSLEFRMNWGYDCS
jgi:hypothetical protein